MAAKPRLEYSDLLEPSIEPSTTGDNVLHVETGPSQRRPRQLLTLELPTAVYDDQTDQVHFQLRPFHFPYTAHVQFTSLLANFES
jgi:hypothetical protein